MKRTPFLLSPAAKDYLWGGSRLNDDFNLALDASPLAEAWVGNMLHFFEKEKVQRLEEKIARSGVRQS